MTIYIYMNIKYLWYVFLILIIFHLVRFNLMQYYIYIIKSYYYFFLKYLYNILDLLFSNTIFTSTTIFAQIIINLLRQNC